MREILDESQNWLADRLGESRSVSLVYARGIDGLISLIGTPGRSTWEVTDASGLLIRHESADFLIKPALLVLDATAIEPLAGDRITRGSYVYEVSAPAPGLPVWHWDGPAHVWFRIHVKQIQQIA